MALGRLRRRCTVASLGGRSPCQAAAIAPDETGGIAVEQTSFRQVFGQLGSGPGDLLDSVAQPSNDIPVPAAVRPVSDPCTASISIGSEYTPSDVPPT
jgi:hypothetical protein